MLVQSKPLTATCMSMLALAACDDRPQAPQAETPAPPDQASVEQPSAKPSPQPQPTEPPGPFYVGRWAAAETACGHAFWDITERGLETSGGVSCRFNEVKPITTGFEAATECTGPQAAGVSRIRFSYAQSAKALLVDAEPFANVGLIACKAG